MGRPLEDRRRIYGSRTLRKKIVDRIALLDSEGKVVLVTCETGGRLTSDQELGQLRVTFVKFRIIGGNFSQQHDGLLVTLVFLRESDKNFNISGLSDKSSLPFRVGKILKTLGLVSLLHQVRIPSADKIDNVARYPMGAL